MEQVEQVKHVEKEKGGMSGSGGTGWNSNWGGVTPACCNSHKTEQVGRESFAEIPKEIVFVSGCL